MPSEMKDWIVPGATHVIVVPHATYDDLLYERPFQSPTGKRFDKMVDAAPAKINIVYRVPEAINRGKKDARVYADKARACRESWLKRASETGVGTLPTLYMGEAANDLHPTFRAHHHYILSPEGHMWVDDHARAFWLRPQLGVLLEAAFPRWVLGNPGIDLEVYELGATERALELLRSLGDEIAYDIETLGRFPDRDPITSFGLSDGTTSVVVPWDTYSTRKHGQVLGLTPGLGLKSCSSLGRAIRQEVIRIVSTHYCITHNGTYDAGGLRPRGIPARNDFDLMAAYQVMYSELPSDLESVCKHLLPIATAWKTVYNPFKKEKQAKTEEEKEKRYQHFIKQIGYEPYMDSPWDVLAKYNARDVFYNFHAAMELRELMNQATSNGIYPNCWKIFKEGMTNLEIAWRMRQWGWQLDERRLQRLKRALEGTIKTRDAQIFRFLPEGVNPRSPLALRKFFYETCQEPVVFKTDSGAPAVNSESVKHIARFGRSNRAKNAAKLLARRKKADTLLSMVEKLEAEPVVRASFLPNKQVTGRWSVFNPPLTNINPTIRKCFQARPGNWIVASDWKAVEQHMIALVAGDLKMLEDISRGVDMHIVTAVDSMKLKPEQVTGALRKVAKFVGFNSNYSSLRIESTAKTILRKLQQGGIYNLTYNDVVEILTNLWDSRKEIWNAKVDSFEFAKKNNYVEEHIAGRRRFFHNVHPPETQCLNHRIQGAVASMASIAIAGIDRELDHTKEGILLLKHDEIVLEGPDPLRLANLLKKHMIQISKFNGNKATFQIDIDIWKKHWHAGKKYKLENL